MTVEILGRIPPHNLAAERALLGGCLLDPASLLLLDSVSPTIFYTGSHRVIAGAMQAMTRDGTPVDLVTLPARLRADGQLEFVGGPAALALLAEHGSIATNAEQYLAEIRRHATRRELVTLGTRVVTAAYDDTEEPAEIIASTVSRVLALDAAAGDVVPVGEIADVEMAGEEPIATGLAVLDDAADGLARGHLTVLAGRPGTGKTALAVQISAHASIALGLPVLFVSLEMPPSEIKARLLSHKTGVPTRHILRSTMADPRIIEEARAKLRRAPLFLQRSFSRQLPDVLGLIRGAVVRHGVRLVIVDHLGRITPARRTTRYEDTSSIAEELKATAMQLRVPILALAQLNRQVETRDVRRPVLSDLRDSGRIEEEADEILFVWSTEERPEGKDPLPVTLTLAKDRNGATGERPYLFEKSRGRFVEQSRRTEPGDLRRPAAGLMSGGR